MFRLPTFFCSSGLCCLLLTTSAVSAGAQNVFINEVHYDNAGTDAGEFVEIAGPAGTDVSGWKIVRYNGSSPAAAVFYTTPAATPAGSDTFAPGTTIPDSTGAGFGFLVVNFLADGLQNGGNDGIALVNAANVVVQFLCYEGVATASNGAAAGTSCADIGVFENGTLGGGSLRLVGNGTTYPDFSWAQQASPQTPGAINQNQSFAAVATPAISSVVPGNGIAGTSAMVTITGTNTHFVPGTTTLGLSGVGVTAGAITVNSGTSLSTVLTIDPAAAAGPRTVTLTTNAETATAIFAVIPITRIHDIQSGNASSPLVGQDVAIEGIVVGDFETSAWLGGFFVQEEDGDVDMDPTTSEGIFVFNNGPDVVSPGDQVQVTGTVAEAFGQTELTSVTNVIVKSTGNTVTPSSITFPVANSTFLERYEGMSIRIDQPMTVSEVFDHARFGEILLSQGGRLLTPTNIVLPGAAAIAQQTANDLRQILLDDGSNTQNPDPVHYPEGNLSANNTARVGEVVNNTPAGQNPILGVLGYDFGTYRIQPTEPLTFFGPSDNPRPVAPAAVGGRVRVAGANVLNFFTTIDTGSAICGPSATIDCRGANTAAEFNRQRDKIVNGLLAMDPHVLGISELENNTLISIQNLVDRMNTVAGVPGKFAFVGDGSTIGTDAIRVALIYQPAVVNPVGGPAILTDAVDARTLDERNRPALAQTFERLGSKANLQRFTVVVNHFKSKGSACSGDVVGGAPDVDTGDGQGECNRTRISIALALVDWLATNPTLDPTPVADRKVIILGDLNSYAMEEPIQAMTNPLFAKPGLTGFNPNAVYRDLISRYVGAQGYSYVFMGQSGYLDHALANPALETLITGVSEFHVNADEPRAIDYNTEFKSPGQVVSFYDSNFYRFSDHDPVLVGFNPLCGDLDDDGDVDVVDQTLIRSKFGLSGLSASRRYDYDRNGTVNSNDYRLWLDCQRQYAAP